MARKTKRTSRPHITRQITLNTYDAQHLFERSYKQTTSAFFLLSIILPAIGNENEADEFSEATVNELKRCGDDLDIEINRMSALIDESGLSIDAVDYTDAQQVNAVICSPMDNLYLGLIQQLDELAGLMSLLWIGGAFDQKQYRVGLQTWRRRVYRLGSRTTVNVSRAMNNANNTGKNDAVTEAMAEHGMNSVAESSQIAEPDSKLSSEQDDDTSEAEDIPASE